MQPTFHNTSKIDPYITINYNTASKGEIKASHLEKVKENEGYALLDKLERNINDALNSFAEEKRNLCKSRLKAKEESISISSNSSEIKIEKNKQRKNKVSGSTPISSVLQKEKENRHKMKQDRLKIALSNSSKENT